MGKHEDLLKQFAALTKKSIEDQAEFFLLSFIFDLDDDWKKVDELRKNFRKYLVEAGEGKDDLNPIQASDYLQKHGLTRTALQRREEVKDIDLDNNDRICLIEMSLLVFKVMILKAYYKRTGESPKQPLTKGGVGIVGVGPQLLEELFTMPTALPPELQKAIEEFTAMTKAREERFAELREKAALGGVKGMAAKNEIEQLNSQDTTEMRKLELTLNAAKKKAMKDGGGGGGDVVAAKKKAEEEEAKKKAQESKARLAAMKSRWEQQ